LLQNAITLSCIQVLRDLTFLRSPCPPICIHLRFAFSLHLAFRIADPYGMKFSTSLKKQEELQMNASRALRDPHVHN